MATTVKYSDFELQGQQGEIELRSKRGTVFLRAPADEEELVMVKFRSSLRGISTVLGTVELGIIQERIVRWTNEMRRYPILIGRKECISGADYRGSMFRNDVRFDVYTAPRNSLKR